MGKLNNGTLQSYERVFYGTIEAAADETNIERMLLAMKERSEKTNKFQSDREGRALEVFQYIFC